MVENNHHLSLLVATTNAHKLSEIRELFASSGICILSPIEVPAAASLEVEETGRTFAENAELKARAFGEASGLRTAADDSGLEVQALGGEPGVQSARWFSGSDEDRVQALLKRMDGLSNREARFTTVVCLRDLSGTLHHFKGTISGRLALEPAGTEGFGYDPIFIPNGYSHTFAELGQSLKNSLSHRALAFAKLLTHLASETKL